LTLASSVKPKPNLTSRYAENPPVAKPANPPTYPFKNKTVQRACDPFLWTNLWKNPGPGKQSATKHMSTSPPVSAVYMEILRTAQSPFSGFCEVFQTP
ncbi:MAG: hypothetical protein AAFR17_02895, partial [Pseudomonadota bacterium]